MLWGQSLAGLYPYLTPNHEVTCDNGAGTLLMQFPLPIEVSMTCINSSRD